MLLVKLKLVARMVVNDKIQHSQYVLKNVLHKHLMNTTLQ